MSRYARISDGVVAEIIATPDGFQVEELYHPDVVATLILVSDDVQAGWVHVAGAFEPPAPAMVDLVAYAASRRWQKEVGGIEVAGVPVATDDRAQIKILGARVAADADPEWSTVWSGADGGSYPVNAAAMIDISNLVQVHINSTYVALASVKAAIAAGEITSTAEIDQAFD